MQISDLTLQLKKQKKQPIKSKKRRKEIIKIEAEVCEIGKKSQNQLNEKFVLKKIKN